MPPSQSKGFCASWPRRPFGRGAGGLDRPGSATWRRRRRARSRARSELPGGCRLRPSPVWPGGPRAGSFCDAEVSMHMRHEARDQPPRRWSTQVARAALMALMGKWMAAHEAPALTIPWSSTFSPSPPPQRMSLLPPQRGRRVDKRWRRRAHPHRAGAPARDRPADRRLGAQVRARPPPCPFLPGERPRLRCRSAPDERVQRAPCPLHGPSASPCTPAPARAARARPPRVSALPRPDLCTA